jgi:hypothetical protein
MLKRAAAIRQHRLENPGRSSAAGMTAAKGLEARSRKLLTTDNHMTQRSGTWEQHRKILDLPLDTTAKLC